MSVPAPRFGGYDCQGRAEFMISFRPEDAAARLLVVPPLFEELNRTRKLLSDLMRALADHGIASDLPDLPGTGESLTPLEETDWGGWRQAVVAAGAAADATHILAIRGGCLLDDAAGTLPHYRFAPVAGKNLLRDLVRARALGDKAFDKPAQQAVYDQTTLLGGYPVSAGMARALRDAEPSDVPSLRTARLESDLTEAEDRIPGAAPWRRAEPGAWPDATATIARNIIAWTR
ncbi:MAG: hypothetical protein ABR601_03270 [Parasphingopyxis sp.]